MRTGPAPFPRGPLIAAAVAGGIVTLAGLLAARDKPGELPVYVRASARLLAGGTLYPPGEEPAFSYPPAFALVTAPLVPLPAFGRRWAWWTLNLALLGGVLWAVRAAVAPALGGAATPRSRRRLWVWGGLTAALGVRFVLSPLQYQSHDLVLLALMTASAVWWTRGANGRAGIAAGVAAACKATPLLALPFFLLRRRPAAAGALLLAAAAATALPDALFPNPAGAPWALTWAGRFVAPVPPGAAPDVDGAWERWNPLNQSLAGTLARLTSDPIKPHHTPVTLWPATPAAARALTLITQAAVLCWLAWCGWRPAANDRPAAPFRDAPFRNADGPPGGLTAGLRCLAELNLVLCGMLLLSPMSSTQHFCFLLPGLAVVAARLVLAPRDGANGLAAAVLLLAGTLPAKDLIGDAPAEAVRSAGGHTLCTLVVLFAGGRLLARDRRAAARAGAEDQEASAGSLGGEPRLRFRRARSLFGHRETASGRRTRERSPVTAGRPHAARRAR